MGSVARFTLSRAPVEGRCTMSLYLAAIPHVHLLHASLGPFDAVLWCEPSPPLPPLPGKGQEGGRRAKMG